MYLGIRTDSPDPELHLYEGSALRATYSWHADRTLAKVLLGELETFLNNNNCSFDSLNGLFVLRGPGSFTGLRIGLTVMNTLSYAQGIPIVGVDADVWPAKGVALLEAGHDDKVVLPFYGSEARITKPKK